MDKTTVSRTLKRAKKTINEIEGAMRNEERAEARGVIDFSSREVAEDILSSLTETQAVYLYLYYGEWLSLRDIGELLDKSHVSVCNGIHRAVKRIREKYNDNEDLMLCGVEDLEPMLYEIYQQPDIEHLVPQRAKDAAKHAYAKRRFPENMERGTCAIGKYGTNRYGHNEEFVKSMTADCSALCKTRQHSAPHRC